jgi:hypothetical protein
MSAALCWGRANAAESRAPNKTIVRVMVGEQETVSQRIYTWELTVNLKLVIDSVYTDL